MNTLTRLKRALTAFWPSPATARGAALGALLAGCLVYAVFALRITQGPLLPRLGMLLVYAVLGGLLIFLGQGIAKLLELFTRLEWRARWLLLAALLLAVTGLLYIRPPAQVLLIGWFLATGLLLGGGVAALKTPGWAARSTPQRVLAAAGLALGGAALLGGLAWMLVYPGSPAKALPDAAKMAAGPPPSQITLPDPSRPGPYAVETLTYGSGADRYRPEYGARAALITRSVNGSKLLSGTWEGPTGALRRLLWDVDPQRLPLNGRVWYPVSADPGEKFPLVLIVHGNHSALDFSDPGYAYLGELLASRGFILASLDMNFLNGQASDFMDPFDGENDARAWLMLEHLRAWKTWSVTAASPFYGRVDLDNIALMGHSRGGEAAAVAAAFNRLPYLPDDYGLPLDYNFNIRAVVAIAPIDGQYNPAWRPTPLSNLSYLILQGSHDSDLTSFSGIQQYERVQFPDSRPEEYFKAALYIYRANHGQFNTRWGSDDLGLWRTFFLNRAALLDGEAQRQVARVYIAAFLEATLRGQAGYRALFADPRAAGPGWLPDTIYINRYDLPGDQLVADFEEDINLQTTSLPGGAIQGEHFTAWREQRLHSKWGSAGNGVVYLGWNESAAPVYSVRLPKTGLALGPQARLLFNLADALQDPPPANRAQPAAGPRQPLDLTIQLEDAQGQTAALPLSRYRPVQPQLEARLFKAAIFERYKPSEPVLQSYALPLADFVLANPRFDPTQLSTVRFVFDRTPRGSLALDAVGIRP